MVAVHLRQLWERDLGQEHDLGDSSIGRVCGALYQVKAFESVDELRDRAGREHEPGAEVALRHGTGQLEVFQGVEVGQADTEQPGHRCAKPVPGHAEEVQLFGQITGGCLRHGRYATHLICVLVTKSLSAKASSEIVMVRTPEQLGARPATRLVSCTALFLIFLDSAVVDVALPALPRDLASSPGPLQWSVNGYLVAFAGLVVLGGGLGDHDPWTVGLPTGEARVR